MREPLLDPTSYNAGLLYLAAMHVLGRRHPLTRATLLAVKRPEQAILDRVTAEFNGLPAAERRLVLEMVAHLHEE